MAKLIPLTQGLTATVDDEDFAWLKQWRWQTQHAASCIYAVRHCQKAGVEFKVYMHRQIMNAKAGEEVHHKNGDTLDNRRENLEIVDPKKHGNNLRKEKANAKLN